MSWEKYKKSRTLRLDLKDIDLDGFWIDLRKVKSFTGAEADVLDEYRKKAESENKADSDEAVAFVLGKMIIGWNITDPDNESVVLPLPSKDPTVIKKLPLEIFGLINTKSAETEGTTVPE